LTLTFYGTLNVASLTNLLTILLISNVIAFTFIVIVSYGISILTFKRGLDPDNFVIPLQSSLADALTTVALFVTLLLLV
jgi:mgtE-like transporter